MTICPHCRQPVDPRATQCKQCGRELEESRTLLRADSLEGPTLEGPTLEAQKPEGTAKAWQKSSAPAIDGARFVAGDLVAGRYRIVGLLGRGGMGEVYRADDLRLGEPVALKFLPASLSGDGGALARFHAEVKIARQIAHKNVCRVHDLGEADDLPFLSMELVGGEDLSSLLRRIGRLPQAKAVQIARQLCYGLAAAHERGVLHRDLKPANVMLDRDGQAKIMDFGLAGLAEDFADGEIAGTPAYMAPEQLESGKVSLRSDLYSLGMVLYELFTEQRPFAGAMLRSELMEQHRSGPPPAPSTLVEGLDPVVDSAILRCLELEPERRPASALEVAAALPGGDPLAAALLAGETPSPEMVAAAPAKGTLSPPVAVGLFVLLLAMLAAWVPIAQHGTLQGLVPFTKSPQVLADRAQEMIAKLTLQEPERDRYQAEGWWPRRGYLNHLRSDWHQDDRALLQQERPAAISYWYRESPLPLSRPDGFPVTPSEPALDQPGMVRIELDPRGRLLSFRAMPQLGGSTEAAGDKENSTPQKVDWSLFFAAAELEASTFTTAEPMSRLPLPTDERSALLGAYPGLAAPTLRIEKGAIDGRPVYFEVLEPWDVEVGGRLVPSLGSTMTYLLFFIVPMMAGLSMLGAWLAYRHLKTGRGDRRGAFRLASIVASAYVVSWLLAGDHSASMNTLLGFVGQLGQAILRGALFWLLVISLEPLLRRLWPETLVSWNRLFAGELRDPLVGRHILIGAVFSLATLLWNFADRWLAEQLFSISSPPGDDIWMAYWLGPRRMLGELLNFQVLTTLFDGFAYLFLLFFFTRLARNNYLGTTLFVLMYWVSVAGPSLAALPFAIVTGVPYAYLLRRCGLVFSVSFWLVFFLALKMPMTTDLAHWTAGPMFVSLGLITAFGFWGMRASLGSQPLFKS